MRLRYLAVLVASSASVLVGCAREGPVATPQLDVVATDYAFSGVPETIRGGAIEITFTNEGKANHELAFAEIGDTSAAAFSKDIAKLDEGGPFPSYLRSGSVPGELEPGKSRTFSINLPQGEYKLSCALTDAPGPGEKEVASHATLGMFQSVDVADGPGELEAPGGVFKAKDYTFTVPENIAAGKSTYVFRNDGPKQWHFLLVQEYPAGVTAEKAMADYGKLLQAPQGQPPPAGLAVPADEPTASTGVFSPGLGQTFEADFKAGRTYMAVCFIQDLAGGAPHAIAHEMYKAFTVPA